MQHSSLTGDDIGQALSSKGAVVKCVLLRHIRPDGKDTKPHPAPSVVHAVAEKSKDEDEKQGSDKKAGKPHVRPVLTELIEEVSVDTTPAKNEISKILGGPFTFVGQFPTEGTMVMARKELEHDAAGLSNQSIHELRDLCKDWGIDTSTMVEKSELVQGLLEEAVELPVNPHRLQPPLDDLVVRGDLLLMRVAETPEEVDEDPQAEIHLMTNEEFFLDYTKEEYVSFAARTDVVAPTPPSPSEDDGDEDAEDGDEDDDEDDYNMEDESEEDKRAMLNLILGEVIKQFREENGRGPDTRELLDLRSQVAEKLGIEVASFDEINESKRAAGEPLSPSSPKRVKFTESSAAETHEGKEEEDSKKPAAKEGVNENGAQSQEGSSGATKTETSSS